MKLRLVYEIYQRYIYPACAEIKTSSTLLHIMLKYNIFISNFPYFSSKLRFIFPISVEKAKFSIFSCHNNGIHSKCESNTFIFQNGLLSKNYILEISISMTYYNSSRIFT